MCSGDVFVYAGICVALGFLSPVVVLGCDACRKGVFFGFVCVRMCFYIR